MSLVSISELDRGDICDILTVFHTLKNAPVASYQEKCKGFILATLFYEPSTRTRLSFESAMLRLGGQVISESNIHFSSRSKGEDLADTARVISSFAHIIALRSTHSGDAERVSLSASIPILNAGDGDGEHPTQALLDLATIYESFPDMLSGSPIHLMIAGDLLYGRTVHSLSAIARHFPNIALTFASPKELMMPECYTPEGAIISHSMDDLSGVDVVYMTRLQKERLPVGVDVDQAFADFQLTSRRAQTLKRESIILHPLPRLSEIPREIDLLPQARYFDQVTNGVYLRMALLLRELDREYFDSFLS